MRDGYYNAKELHSVFFTLYHLETKKLRLLLIQKQPHPIIRTYENVLLFLQGNKPGYSKNNAISCGCKNRWLYFILSSSTGKEGKCVGAK